MEKVLTEAMPDGRLLLQLKDEPFSQPIQARFASDGTIKMLAYLILLRDPHRLLSSGLRSLRTIFTRASYLNLQRSSSKPPSVPKCSSPPSLLFY